MHCFSMPAHLDECLERGYAISFAGNVTYKSAAELAAAARRVPDERLLVETDAPYLTPQKVRKHPNQPAFVAHTAAFLAELRGVSVDELGAPCSEPPRACSDGEGQRCASAAEQRAIEPSRSRARSAHPCQRALRQFDVRPDRELGQNFLIDSNILGVIGRSRSSPSDVVLEIGGGLGVLSEYLAARAAHVHVVEIDERLATRWMTPSPRFANVTLHWGDAMAVDLAGLRPRPRR